jgi:hypothetical protein
VLPLWRVYSQFSNNAFSLLTILSLTNKAELVLPLWRVYSQFSNNAFSLSTILSLTNKAELVWPLWRVYSKTFKPLSSNSTVLIVAIEKIVVLPEWQGLAKYNGSYTPQVRERIGRNGRAGVGVSRKLDKKKQREGCDRLSPSGNSNKFWAEIKGILAKLPFWQRFSLA